MKDSVDPHSIRGQVAALPPTDARERESIATFLTAFDRLERPFDEHGSPTHVTASAIVTGEGGVVLHLHKRLSIWLQPGGHIDAGEAPWQAAL
ncbi:MAG TPA: NUDIX domain-containing protein, partial [Ilumatobacteraceae bacterium]